MPTLAELQEARASAVAEMRTLNSKAEVETRDLTADEDKQFNTLKATISDLDRKIGRAQALAEAERSAPAIIHGRGDGLFEERARKFPLTKMMRAMLPGDLGGGGVDIGEGRELSRETEIRSGRKFQGIAVPDEYFQVEHRTLLVGSSGADLVANPHLGGQFIDLLRARLVCASLGATYLDGLVGSPIDIPRQTGKSTVQWVAEDGDVTETDASFDDVSFTPKTAAAMTSYSRRLMLNASPAIEDIIRRDLAASIASAIDEKAMIGDGSSNTPTGIINAGATMVAMTDPTWAGILSFIGSVDGDNALGGSLGWAMNVHVRTVLRSTLVAASTDSRMLMQEPNSLAGYPAVATGALPGEPPGESPSSDGHLIFGDWSSLMIGSWSGVDVLLNPYESTAYAKGRVKVRAMKDLDVQVRHPEAFAYSNTVSND